MRILSLSTPKSINCWRASSVPTRRDSLHRQADPRQKPSMVSDYGDERDSIHQPQVSQHPAKDVLSHRMHRDDHLRTVAFKELLDVACRETIEETRLVRTQSLDRPVVVAHQRLMVSQQVVVKVGQLLSEDMRLLDGADDVYQAFMAGNRLRPSAIASRLPGVPAACVGGDNRELFCAIVGTFRY